MVVVLRAVLDAVAPPACLVCRAPPPRGSLVCGACLGALPWLADPCPRCALPRAGGRCARCPAAGHAYARAFAPLAHVGVARDLLLALKLRGALPAADLMAAHVVARAPAGLLDGAALVPVPGQAERRRRRGLDPAQCLARALARRTGAPVADALRRTDAGGRQVGRGRAGRRRAPRIVCAGRLPDTPLVLVDDVHTTGATLDACARALRDVAFPHIAAVTYVRTLTPLDNVSVPAHP